MDELHNPYAPGAGTLPPELTGRDGILEGAAVALDRVRLGRSARSHILYGLRGVGKTVLLNRIVQEAQTRGHITTKIEAPEGRSLPSLLVPALRATLIRVSAAEKAKAGARAAMRVLGSFLKSMKITFGDVEASIDVDAAAGLADSGDLAIDLADLFASLGDFAKDQKTALVIAIDELQYVPQEQLEALIQAQHQINQRQLPVVVIAAGLPQLITQLGQAKSYAERLFQFELIDRLDDTAATLALCKPAERENVAYDPGAIAEILKQTRGYPYFLQEWGKHTWRIAPASPIQPEDARAATESALAELDAGFFRVRFERLTPGEKRYLRAMAELGPGPHRSGDVAERLGKRVTAYGPVRSSLIAKGMLYSPAHGETAFTVPLFDGFMKRTMPDALSAA